MTHEILPVDSIEPNFDISESNMLEIGDKSVGEKLQAIIDYQVVEKTKSFTILKINHIFLIENKRKF